MTNHWIDFKNTDCVMVCGSNIAENHPCSFKWIDKAMNREKDPAKLIVVDPRFTRTASRADIFAQHRPGTDVAFFGGLVNYAMENDLIQKEYVVNYTNASFLINPGYSFKDGLFSGYNEKDRKYDKSTWAYQTGPDGNWLRDATLQDPNCVFQLTKKHFSRYTPELVSKITGIPKDKFLEIAKTYCATAKPEKVGTLAYAMGLTQHTNGTQNIRCFALLQLLLGNTGCAGGGIMALRGESNVQGSTDEALLWHIIPAYMSIPSSQTTPTLAAYIESKLKGYGQGYWKNMPKFLISLLKSFWGDHATAENDFAFDLMPKVDNKNYSHIAMFEAMYAGDIKGLMCWGQNPSVGGPNANMENTAMDKLDWLVCMDLWETETSVFWKRPGAHTKDIKTEVFLLPAASSIEKEGTITNSGRWIQWRYKAIEPPGDVRTDAAALSQLGHKLKELYKADKGAPVPEALTELYWPYDEEEPDSDKILRELNGFTWADKKQVKNFTKLKDDGSTACANWLFSGVYPEEGNLSQRTINEDPSGLGLFPKWTFCWPVNRRIIYNRCSCDVAGKPWNSERDLVKWDGAQWVNNDVPDFGWKNSKTGAMIPPEKSAARPYIMLDEGVGRLFVKGMKDGPLPEHYEPLESPVDNQMSDQQNDPVIKIWDSKMDGYAEVGSTKYPIVCTTWRVTEQWQAGQMSRNSSWLCEMQPEVFVEMSTKLAEEKGIKNGDWVLVESVRGEVKAVAMVTERIQPLSINGKTVHVVGLPWHYGFVGLCKGGPEKRSYAANQLSPHVGDANTMIPEYKAFLVNVNKA